MARRAGAAPTISNEQGGAGMASARTRPLAHPHGAVTYFTHRQRDQTERADDGARHQANRGETGRGRTSKTFSPR